MNIERQTNNKKSRKMQKCYELICILISEISIFTPMNQQYLWHPDVFYMGNKLISTPYLSKRHLEARNLADS